MTTNTLPPLPERAKTDYENLRMLVDFAYEQGFHEMGYDPLDSLVEALRQSQSLPAGAVSDAMIEAAVKAWAVARDMAVVDHAMEHVLEAALQADAREKGDVEYQFEVWQGDECLAMGSAATSHECGAESAHMAMMYGQDGPVTVRYYERYEITDEPATQPAQALEKVNG